MAEVVADDENMNVLFTIQPKLDKDTMQMNMAMGSRGSKDGLQHLVDKPIDMVGLRFPGIDKASLLSAITDREATVRLDHGNMERLQPTTLEENIPSQTSKPSKATRFWGKGNYSASTMRGIQDLIFDIASKLTKTVLRWSFPWLQRIFGWIVIVLAFTYRLFASAFQPGARQFGNNAVNAFDMEYLSMFHRSSPVRFDTQTALNALIFTKIAYESASHINKALSSQECYGTNVRACFHGFPKPYHDDASNHIIHQAFYFKAPSPQPYHVICFRGSELAGANDWIENLRVDLIRPRLTPQSSEAHVCDAKDCRRAKPKVNAVTEHDKIALVHQNFFSGARGLYEATKLVPESPNLRLIDVLRMDNDPVLITGHSLGGAVAVCMADLLERHKIARERLFVITFGQPRLGNDAYVQNINMRIGRRIVRYIHGQDVVPRVPPWFPATSVGTRYDLTSQPPSAAPQPRLQPDDNLTPGSLRPVFMQPRARRYGSVLERALLWWVPGAFTDHFPFLYADALRGILTQQASRATSGSDI
jgi:hypothetical protein